MGTNYTIADWIAGTAILLATLIVPFAIRRWIVRRPLSKTTAGLTAFGIWLGLFSFFWWAASLANLQEAYSRKPHLGILAIAVISYWMLTSAGKNTPQRADDGSSSGDSCLGTESRRTPQYDSTRAAAGMRKHRATAPPETVVSKPMNWKRGLLRLWFFLSVLWVAGSGSIAVLESSPMQEQLVLDRESTPVEPDPIPNLTEYGTSDSGREEQATRSADAFLDAYEPLPHRDNVQQPRTDQKVSPVDTSGLTAVRYVRDWNLPEWRVMAAIISVPALVLGLGAAVAWVIIGFRDPRKHAAQQSGD